MSASTLNITHALPLPQLVIGEASVGSTYTLVGTFTEGVVWLLITSTLNGFAQISFDGTHDHIPIPIGSTDTQFIPIDFKAFRTILSAPYTSVYVKSSSVSAGSLYVSAFACQGY